jgi:signal transduction histidine kinase
MTILNRVGTGESRGSRVPALPRTALWLTAYVAASLLGRVVVVQPEKVGLVWPAAGVALAWLASSNRRLLPIDLALMSVSTVAVLAITEGGVARSILSLSVVLQTVLAVLLLRRFVPGIWGAGGREPFTRLAQLGWTLATVIGAAFVTAVLRSVIGAIVFENESLDMLAGRFGRQASALATIGVFGLLLGGWLAQRRDRGLPLLGPITRRDVIHLLGIELLTAVIFVGFWRNPEIPTTYVLSLTVVWTAIRFNPVITAVHCLLTGVVTVLMTILGYGPLANVSAPDTRALLAQVFVVVLMVTGMTISLIRRQITETISSLEQSEATVAMRADELDMVMSRLEDGVAIIEETGRVVHANTALRTAFGTRPANTADRISDPREEEGELYYPDGRLVPPEENPYLRALSGDVVDAVEYHHPEEDGSVRVIEISAFQVPTAAGAPRRVMVVVRDVTSATTHRESLISFAGTVAHDLNNPLSVIDGWAEALEEELIARDSPQAARDVSMVQHIRASVEQARGFISALLAHSVSRDQALECEPIALRNLVKHIAATHDRPRAGGDIIAGDLLDVWADRVLVRQVLDNLVGNAFKYVAPGTTPRVLIEAEHIGEGWARVMVRDNGIGVPLLQRERVFESFHRATDGYQGTGLGLAICKRIIHRHGGSIRVTANPDGVGSCFEFTLPATAEAFARAATS